MSDPIPEDVRRFVVDKIDSVPALEALLLMRKSPARRWTVPVLAAELYLPPARVAGLVADLPARGLCGVEGESEPLYFWRPATPEIGDALDRLADVYRRYLVPVTNLIHSKPGPSVRGFSDAFRIRGQE